MSDFEASWRINLVRVLSHWIAPRYTRFVGASAEYGMRAAARDHYNEAPYPPDWRNRMETR